MSLQKLQASEVRILWIICEKGLFMEKTTHNYSLDFLKIVAATGIVFHHYQATTGVRFENFINFKGSWFDWGYLVELFFILSGYFTYRYISVIREGSVTLFDWWKKRALRLLPMCAISVVAFEIIILIYNSIFTQPLWNQSVSIWNTFIAAIGVQEGWSFFNPVINNSVWYISVLMLCYILFYVFTALSAKIKCNPLYFYVAVIFFGIGIRIYGIEKPFMNWQVSRGYYAFFFGLLLAAYISKYGIRKKEIVISSILTVGLILVFIFCPQYATQHINFIITFLLFPSIIILFETKPAHMIFRHKIWETISGISFEVYLWHLPLMVLWCLIRDSANWYPNMNSVWSMMIFTLASWAVGTIMYFCLERPITRCVTGTKKEKKGKKPKKAKKAKKEEMHSLSEETEALNEPVDALSEEANQEIAEEADGKLEEEPPLENVENE